MPAAIALAGDNRGDAVPLQTVKIIRVEVRLLLPDDLGTSRRFRPIAVKVVDATTNVVASDQMLCSIGFFVTMDALGRGISRLPGRGAYPDLMNAD